MRSSLHLLIATALVGMPLNQAAGQLKPETPTGSHLQRKPTIAPAKDTRQIIAEFARCVVKRHRTEVAQLVLSGVSNPTGRKVADPDCLWDTMAKADAAVALSLPPTIFEYALADVLVKDEFPKFDASLITTAGPIRQPVLDPTLFAPKPGKHYGPEELQELERTKAKMIAGIAFSQFGECVARADPVGSYALLGTEPTSPAEGAAIQALMPALAGCLDQGEQFDANRTNIRGIIAVNLYRLAHAPRVPPTSGAPK